MTADVKELLYREILDQWEGLARHETERLALLANTVALLHHGIRPHWTGFYLVKDTYLTLGPFQGPVACSRIDFGQGVCGQAWAARKPLIVPDVHQWPGHIACSPLSQSEVVVPVFRTEGSVVAVLDMDSAKLAAFDVIDVFWLEHMMQRLGSLWTKLT